MGNPWPWLDGDLRVGLGRGTRWEQHLPGSVLPQPVGTELLQENPRPTQALRVPISEGRAELLRES